MFYYRRMSTTTATHAATLWMVNGAPACMIYAGKRWRVTDTPTRIRESVWAAPLEEPARMYGWRFQGTAPDGQSFVFDVFRAADDWHVHAIYR